MKDTLILQNKIYISAKRAVKISGYAPDYIGQLCRENKLDCKMVGRSWFVTEDSLISHKNSFRAEKEKIVIVKDQLEAVQGDSVILDRKNFISTKKAAEISGYTTDYIGQLCRSGKFESKRVGNAWFVSEKSLLAHCINQAVEEKATPPPKLVIPVMIQKSEPVEIIKEEIDKKKDKLRPIESSSTINQSPVNKNEERIIKKNKNLVYLNQFSKIFLGLGLSLFVILLLFETITRINILPKKINQISMNIPNSVDRSNTENTATSIDAIAVTPSTGSILKDEEIKKEIKDSFSDEINIKPDSSGSSGIITPVFKKAKAQDFVYVMVPVNKNQ